MGGCSFLLALVEGLYVYQAHAKGGGSVYQAHAKGGGSVIISGPCQRWRVYVYQAHANGGGSVYQAHAKGGGSVCVGELELVLTGPNPTESEK